ncbi:hypothetical protein [Streptomyces sp. NPDC094468]|uniref:hypothetical protein n=1 Tax=Streptomyces sp. NPDC094468 TaxID=3366066 RepID=UPI00381F6E90
MSAICRTPADAFQAGWDQPCDHGAAPEQCHQCCLTDAEIGQLVALLGHVKAPHRQESAAA